MRTELQLDLAICLPTCPWDLASRAPVSQAQSGWRVVGGKCMSGCLTEEVLGAVGILLWENGNMLVLQESGYISVFQESGYMPVV